MESLHIDYGMSYSQQPPRYHSFKFLAAFPNLKHLRVSVPDVETFHEFDPATLDQLELTYLEVALDNTTLDNLLASQAVNSLRVLNLMKSRIDSRGIIRLANTASLANLQELNLFGFPIEAPAALALANSRHLNRLLRLDLRGNRFSAPIAAALQDRFGDALQIDSTGVP